MEEVEEKEEEEARGVQGELVGFAHLGVVRAVPISSHQPEKSRKSKNI